MGVIKGDTRSLGSSFGGLSKSKCPFRGFEGFALGFGVGRNMRNDVQCNIGCRV